MPESFFSLFPYFQTSCEAVNIPIRAGAGWFQHQQRALALGFDLLGNLQSMGLAALQGTCPPGIPLPQAAARRLFGFVRQEQKSFLDLARSTCLDTLRRLERHQRAEADFIDLFASRSPAQAWSAAYDPDRVLIDLPGMRLVDISLDGPHALDNYTVVFAPRAGHHSNIAERVAVFLRDSGLTRMAVVEQKCADDIPVTVEGKRHREDFDSQVNQYRAILERALGLTGRPPHLIAVCQPGPLLAATLIRYPHLGRTFGSAGSPMHTEAGPGYLTDFARQVGAGHIDRLLRLFGKTARDPGGEDSREVYDGRLQVLGFYLLGIDQHLRNFRRLHLDLKRGDMASAERQKAFYHWYNYVLHFPGGFIRDTFKRIFVNNELIRGGLPIHGATVRIQDYPPHVPVWALAGSRDEIAPPLQATGHMELVPAAPENKLTLVCEGGHMALFRSRKILQGEYLRIRDFILAHSDLRG